MQPTTSIGNQLAEEWKQLAEQHGKTRIPTPPDRLVDRLEKIEDLPTRVYCVASSYRKVERSRVLAKDKYLKAALLELLPDKENVLRLSLAGKRAITRQLKKIKKGKGEFEEAQAAQLVGMAEDVKAALGHFQASKINGMIYRMLKNKGFSEEATYVNSLIPSESFKYYP